MKKFLFGLLIALTPLLAFADGIARLDGGITVIAREDEACSPRVQKIIALAQAPAELVWSKADVDWKGEKLDACWALKNDRVLVVDERGVGGVIPLKDFTVYPGV